MPQVGRVLDAVRLFLSGPLDGSDGAVAGLEEAMAALDAKLATVGGPVSKVEQDRTWGEVVAGDEIQSAKTKGWFEVHTTVRMPSGQVKVMIKATPKPILRNPRDPVRLRRGIDGEALDIVEVLFSGTPVNREAHAPVSKDAGPMLTDKVEDDD